MEVIWSKLTEPCHNTIRRIIITVFRKVDVDVIYRTHNFRLQCVHLPVIERVLLYSLPTNRSMWIFFNKNEEKCFTIFHNNVQKVNIQKKMVLCSYKVLYNSTWLISWYMLIVDLFLCIYQTVFWVSFIFVLTSQN